MVDSRGVFSVPAFPLEKVFDPTGAGDSFAGGFMGYLASSQRMSDAVLRRAMVYGSVMGSFAVERSVWNACERSRGAKSMRARVTLPNSPSSDCAVRRAP